MQETVQQIVKPTPHALFGQILTMFSGTLNVGNVQFYFPDSSVLNRVAGAPTIARDLFVAATDSLDVSTTHTSQLFSALTLNTKSI